LKKTIKLLIILPMLFCVLCIGVYSLLYNSKIGSHQIENLDALLIEESDFPAGWKLEYKLPITGDYAWGEKNIMAGFSLKPELGSSRQYVYHFNSIFAAKKGYYFLGKSLPLVSENQISFLNYESSLADTRFMACEEPNLNTVICDFFNRYDDFIVYFNISVKKELFTPEQLRKILVSIEDRMAKQLEK